MDSSFRARVVAFCGTHDIELLRRFDADDEGRYCPACWTVVDLARPEPSRVGANRGETTKSS